MRGSQSDPGMMILCIRDILDWVDSHKDVEYKLSVTYMEVYNEEINDLLGDGPDSKNLKIVSEDNIRGAVIGNLNEDIVKTHEDFLEVLRKGEANRSYASTTMNADSSRSLVIYRVTVEVFEKEEAGSGGSMSYMAKKPAEPIRISYLNLVDLAGSERQKQTNASGKTLKEGANINKSLLALGAVINKLGEASAKKPKKGEKPILIPYRDSKLTRILKQSLGGNTMTSILCAVSPADQSREETVSTLKFGQLCKTIKNAAKANEVIDDRTLMKQLKAQVAELKAENEELKSGGGGALVAQLNAEKFELESRILALEAMLGDGASMQDGSSGGENKAEGSEDGQSSSSGGGDNGDGSKSADASKPEGAVGVSRPPPRKAPMGMGLSSANNNTLSLYKALQETKDELFRTTEKLSDCQRRVFTLQKKCDIYKNFEATKAEFEEYEQATRQELDEDKAKIESDKQHISSEKYKLLTERTNLDDKEQRIGLLLANLDEKDSKLRQLMATMKEQQEHLHRSVSDLQRREELVEEWQRSHRQREMKLHEMRNNLDEKYNELNQRDSKLIETEHKWVMHQRELSEREQRLQIALSRLANNEQALARNEENLAKLEVAHKKREHECDVKERELQVRRREMESWDSLLREKDRKISMEQRMLDEREDSVRSQEEKFRHREIEVERKVNECKLSEANVQGLIENYNAKLVELEQREKLAKIKATKIQKIEEELTAKENELSVWETSLQQLQEKMQGIEAREYDLAVQMEKHKKIEDEFFNVKVAAITARHTHDINELEKVIEQQLQIISNFQNELEKAKDEISVKNREYDGLLEILDERDMDISRMKDELFSLSKQAVITSHKMESNENEMKNPTDALLDNIDEPKTFVLRSQQLGNSIRSYYNTNTANKGSGHKSNEPQYKEQEFVYESSDEDDDYDASHVGYGEGDVSGQITQRKVNKSRHFMLQMLETQKLLFSVLEQNMLLPNKNEPLLAYRHDAPRTRRHDHDRVQSQISTQPPSVASTELDLGDDVDGELLDMLAHLKEQANLEKAATEAAEYVPEEKPVREVVQPVNTYDSFFVPTAPPTSFVPFASEPASAPAPAVETPSIVPTSSISVSKPQSINRRPSNAFREQNPAAVSNETPTVRETVERPQSIVNSTNTSNDTKTSNVPKTESKPIFASRSSTPPQERDFSSSIITNNKPFETITPFSQEKVSQSIMSSAEKSSNDFQLNASKRVSSEKKTSSGISPGRRSPSAAHINKLKQEVQSIRNSPGINNFVEESRRGGVPVAKIALDIGGTKKIVQYMSKSEHSS